VNWNSRERVTHCKVGVVAHEQLSANCKVAQLAGMNSGPKRITVFLLRPVTHSELLLSLFTVLSVGVVH